MPKSGSARPCPGAPYFPAAFQGRRGRIVQRACLLDLLLPNPPQVTGEQLANILDSPAHHVEPVDSQTPSDDWDLDAQRLCDLWSEDPAASELQPAKTLLVRLQLNAWLGEREVVRLETHLVGACDFSRKHF